MYSSVLEYNFNKVHYDNSSNCFVIVSVQKTKYSKHKTTKPGILYMGKKNIRKFIKLIAEITK